MKKSIAVIGLSRFGLSLLESLSRLNVDLIAIDVEEEQVRKATAFTHNAFIVDVYSSEALKESGVANVDHAIVAIGQNEKENLTTSIIAVIKLKELGVKQITARADDEDYAEVLKLVGATDVVLPLSIAAERISNKLAATNVLDYFNVRDNYDIYDVKIGKNFVPTTIIELKTRAKYNVNILLIERDKVVGLPTKDTILYPGDEVFLFGDKQDVTSVLTLFK